METAALDRESFRRKVAEILSGSELEEPGDAAPSLFQQSPQDEPARAKRPAALPVESAPEARAELAGDQGNRWGAPDDFVPYEPDSLIAAGLSEALVESLVLKCLARRSAASGREIADQIKLPFRMLVEILRQLKDDRLVVYKAAAPMSDYVYEITEAGSSRARHQSEQSSYFDAAPVPLEHYAESVAAQSIRHRRPRLESLQAAFADLVIGEELFLQLGQAISSGLGIFLYGSPGNGKTSLAERITGTLGDAVWIPRAILAAGEIIRVYDPSIHEMLPQQEPATTGTEVIDRRWVQIRRPTIVVGGELTLDLLDITVNPATGVAEAPLQMKSNGGTLVIDDFGRQRVTPAELLNRWIVPLEKRYDFLNLTSGRKIQVPFDQLIVFSTNLDPSELVDEAFLRRIPYKIDVQDPNEAEFRRLFERVAASMGIAYHREPVDYLIATHYRATGRPMRFCHPRDLLHQVRIYCEFLERPRALTREALDSAAKNYFAIMDGGDFSPRQSR